jgi:hypothetical protein
MQLSHTFAAMGAEFDDASVIGSAGLVPLVALAQSAGLPGLVVEHLAVPTDKGANADLKVMSLVAGMAAGADSIDDMAVLRHGGMGRAFDCCYAPSTLGSFLRSFAFGHVRQLDAVASRFLAGLARRTPVLAGIDQGVVVDVDDTIVEVHGYAKQGAGFGYSGVRGLNAIAATVTTKDCAPVIVATRLRKGSAGSARGAGRIVADALATVRRLRAPGAAGTVLLRADSAYYGRPTVLAAVRAGAHVSITVRLDTLVRKAIQAIDDDAWTPIQYPHAVRDEATGAWVSRAEVAEVPFTAFASAPKADQVPGRLVVRRIPDLNPPADPSQASLFEVFRFHAFFTTTQTASMDTVAADKTHRGHAIIEQVFADLKGYALAHLPSGSFAANSAWLVLAAIAFNLVRAAGTIAAGKHARATTATLRTRIINIPARVVISARRITLRLPAAWPWKDAWTTLFHATIGPPRPATT